MKLLPVSFDDLIELFPLSIKMSYVVAKVTRMSKIVITQLKRMEKENQTYNNNSNNNSNNVKGILIKKNTV